MPPLESGNGRPIAAVATASLAMSLAACSASPSQNILGSFFPAWLLCATIGIVAAVVVRLALVRAGIDRAMPVPLLAYAAIAFALTCLIWLVQFGG